MYYLYGVIAYLLVGWVTIAVDAYSEYRQKVITKFEDYNRQLAIQITLLWPLAWAWVIVTGAPAILFWVFRTIGGNPFLNIKQSVAARRRQRSPVDVPYDQTQDDPSLYGAIPQLPQQ